MATIRAIQVSEAGGEFELVERSSRCFASCCTGYTFSNTTKGVEMLKRLMEFLTLKWLWDRRGGRRR